MSSNLSTKQPEQKGGTSLRTFYQLIKEALSGNNQDYTKGSIRKAVLLLSVPMILEMCMESVFAVVDIFFVGKLGKGAVATVGLTESVLTIIYSVAIGLSMAATAMVARRIGEKDPVEASRSAAQAINLSLILTVMMSLIGFWQSPNILKGMGASADVVEMGASYTRIMFGGSVVIVLLFLINGIFRGAGNASIAMWSLWIANGCNIILCPVLIHFYGLKGAAFATTIGRGIGVCYQIFHLLKGRGLIRLMRRYFIPDKAIIQGLAGIAWTGTLQFLIGSASWMVMARIMARFGDASIAGYQVAIRIMMFFILPAWGMSNAAATLVGQNLGAGQPDRAERSVLTVVRYNAVFMFGVTLLFLFGSEYIVAFMNQDPEVRAIASRALHIISIGYVFYGVGMVLTSAFNGAGDTRTPTIINLICFWAFQIPVAYILAESVYHEPTGVFLAILLAETAITVIASFTFRKGRWKKINI